MNNQEFWEEQCDKLLDALWSGWEQFYPGHKRPDTESGGRKHEGEAQTTV